MALYRFTKAFDWLGPSRYCVICKLATWAFKPSPDPIEIPDAAADAADAAGAGERVTTPKKARTNGR